MTKRAILTCFLFFCIWNAIKAQDEELVVSATNLINLSSLNTESLDEAAPFITLDGKRIYFTRTNDQNEKLLQNNILHEIWYADFENGQFIVKKAPKPLNAGLNSAVIGYNYAGDRLYLFGTYNKLFEDQNGLSYSNFKNGNWSKPKKIHIPGLAIQEGFYGIYMHPSENLVLISKGRASNEDLYVSEKGANGKWSMPVSLGSQINTEAYEISPFISEDLKYLFFSRGAPGIDTDIYYAERLGTGWTEWTEPKRLGTPVNSSGFDAYFSMLTDSTIVFSSNRTGSSDIYLAKLHLKHADRPKPKTEVKVTAPTIASTTSFTIKKPAPPQLEHGKYVFFDFNHHQIPANQEPALNEIAGSMLTDPALRIVVSGHTDYIDTEEFNQQLSEKRTAEVIDYLVRKGIPENRISQEAHGELMPISNNAHRLGRKLNRRVEIYWVQTSQ